MSRTAREWERVPSLPPTHYLDNSIYTSEEIFSEEQEKIFKKLWIWVCHESEVVEVFDFRTVVVAGTPLVVTRGEDGQIRTFLNICSHRGAEVVREPAGNAPSFTCLFHLWSYDTKGNCVSVTRDEAYAPVGIRKEDMGLREIRTEVRLGLVFVNLDDEAETLASYLGEAMENAEAILGTDPLEVYHYHEIELEANWKNIQELTSEIYHEWLHSINRRTSVQEPGYYDRVWKFYPNGHATLLGALLVAYGKQQGYESERAGNVLPGLQPNEYRVVDVWPDTALVFRDSGFRLDTLVPLSADRTIIQMRALGVKGESSEDRRGRYKDHNTIWGPFGLNVPEDNIAAASQKSAMKSGLVRWSLIAREEQSKTQCEAPLRNFYAEWERRMGRSSSKPAILAAE